MVCLASEVTKSHPTIGEAAFSLGQVKLNDTLKKLFERAYSTSEELKSKYFDSLNLNTRVATQFSKFLPTLDATFSNTRSHSFNSGASKDIDSTALATPSRQASTTMASGVRLNLNLFRGGSDYAGYRSAFYQAVSGWANFLVAEQNVLLEVIEAILDLEAQQSKLATQHSSLNLLQRNYDAVQQKEQLGESSLTELALARSRLEEARAGLNSVESDLSRAEQVLERLFNTSLPAHLPKINLPEQLIPIKEEDVISYAISHNPSLISATNEVLSAKEDKSAIGGALMPTIDLVGSVDHNNVRSARGYGGDSNYGDVPQRNRATSTSMAIQAKMPLYEGGSIRSQQRGAGYKLSAKNAQLIETKRKITQNVRQLWSQYKSSLANIALHESQVRQFAIALSGVREEYNLGSKTIIDVLNVQKDHVAAQQALIATKKTYSSSVVRLLAMMGSLNAKLFTLNVERLDPKRDYYEKELLF